MHQKGGVHILKISEVLRRYKVSAVSSSTRIVESRDKGFVLDLKFLFTTFQEGFLSGFFIMKLVCFIGFSWVIVSCLIYFSVMHDIDTILIFV